ncbi:hypothetical protein A8C56_15825 [Niabella ginsenosidivorans]|uniref:Iron dicitrate transport regulator FecR n=1 Tax=Niabella ginsenosidivorans TaxID=1176587 RepID=A0A1A9I4J1_9BACT|nr:FecR family protein [Niabella ginsenosidivorans]ANH82235.1 hypothetical protein A8C56_15825 [Niabella ginsenosidivorans]
MQEEPDQLWDKYVKRTASEGELEKLFEYLRDPDADPHHIAWLENYFASGKEEPSFDENYWAGKIGRILHPEEAALKADNANARKRWMLRVAAMLIALAGAGLFFLKMQHRSSTPESSGAPTTATAGRISPGNGASITLADGRTVLLDSVTNRQLVMQGNGGLLKLADGRIVYEQLNNTAAVKEQSNTLNNPRGGRVVDMVLSDGTHVWLNAASSISYPVIFSGKERKVKMSGEAYFEVAHDPSRPFYVEKDGLEIKVLGTHFNITAYADDPVPSITLLQGKVSVAAKRGGKTVNALQIKPGQQALLVNDQLMVNNAPDLNAVMAWKNGDFEFTGSSIQSVMRQIGRWYDMDVVYQGEMPSDEFIGKISRQEDVSRILKILEATGKVAFHIEGRKIIVHKL